MIKFRFITVHLSIAVISATLLYTPVSAAASLTLAQTNEQTVDTSSRLLDVASNKTPDKITTLAAATSLDAESATLSSQRTAASATPSQADLGSRMSETKKLQAQLANPVASLITVPIQTTYFGNIGPDKDGYRIQTQFQPAFPVTLSKKMILVVRTLMPIVYQHNIAPGSGNQSGLGDTLQTFFFSPQNLKNNLLVGFGPAMLWPTATDDLLGAGKWGAGPALVVAKQTKKSTFGMLTTQTWSFAGDKDRDGINLTAFQPFFAYRAGKGITYTTSSQSNYNWKTGDWAVPIFFDISKVTKIGKQRVSLRGGIYYWATSPDNQPSGLGARINLTFIFKK